MFVKTFVPEVEVIADNVLAELAARIEPEAAVDGIVVVVQDGVPAPPEINICPELPAAKISKLSVSDHTMPPFVAVRFFPVPPTLNPITLPAQVNPVLEKLRVPPVTDNPVPSIFVTLLTLATTYPVKLGKVKVLSGVVGSSTVKVVSNSSTLAPSKIILPVNVPPTKGRWPTVE